MSHHNQGPLNGIGMAQGGAPSLNNTALGTRGGCGQRRTGSARGPRPRRWAKREYSGSWEPCVREQPITSLTVLFLFSALRTTLRARLNCPPTAAGHHPTAVGCLSTTPDCCGRTPALLFSVWVGRGGREGRCARWRTHRRYRALHCLTGSHTLPHRKWGMWRWRGQVCERERCGQCAAETDVPEPL